MKIAFTFLLLFTLQVSILAQSAKIDSLERLLSQSKPDTARIALLTELGTKYWSSQPKKTLEYAQKALALSKQLKYASGEARSYQVFGIYYWQKNEYATSLDYYSKGRLLYQSINDPKGVANCLSNAGIVYREQGNYAHALDNYLQALTVYRALNQEINIANMLNSIGIIHKNQKNYEEALTSYQEALAIFMRVGNQQATAGILANIGTIHGAQGKFELAIESTNKSLLIFEKLKDSNGQIICHNDLGDMYFQKGNFAESITKYEKAVTLNEQYQSKKLMVTSFNGLGKVYINLNQATKASDYYQRSSTLAQTLGLRPALQEAYAGLAEVYSQQNDYPKAFKFQQMSSTLKDSLFNAENANKIANLRVSYENEKKQIEVTLLQKEKDLGYATRNTIAVALAAGLLLITVAFNRQRLITNKDRQVHQMQQTLAETEIRNRQEREEQLQRELEFRNKSLTTHTLNLIQKNGILTEIRETVSVALKAKLRDENTPLLSRLINLIDYSFNLDQDWEEFKLYFEGVHQNFFTKLKAAHTDLGPGELRLCALVRLNLSLKECATLLSISPDSVKTARHRLRKKLNLPEDNNLVDYVMAI
ncbi:MAG: tetratricopeptide repeat protein [Bacteroidota bacterium]